MKKILLGAAFFFAAFFAAEAVMAAPLINGAGATFPYPIYAKWAYVYNKATGVRINYQSIGSGGGVRQAIEGTVDFGASDAPMTPEELEKAGLLQFPMVMGGVVPVINVKGVKAGELKLTPELLADIYLKKITKWNDERLVALNPDVALPAKRITVVRRSDGSGTTWIFTNYLAKVSAAWKSTVGFGKAVSWPTGVGGKGNEGVATYVKRIKNSIGYVEYAYALQNRLVHTKLKNRAGNFVEPNMAGFSAAASGADWEGTPGFAVVLTDTAGKKAWPIAGATFILMKKEAKKCANAEAALKFFDWAYKNGADMALSLDYVPMPKTVYTLMENTWKETIKCNGAPVWK
jgi:phosphate transport system substrate-binding protein